MPDSRDSIADRLERAADRMSNAGSIVEERRFRAAAAQIRAGFSHEEACALGQQMLPGLTRRRFNKLTALAAMGEYDLGDVGAGSISDAAADDFDGDLPAGMESDASQLLSTARSNGLSDPFSSVQDGWISNSRALDPYTGTPAGGGSANAYTGGQGVDAFTGMTPEGENVNAFTEGQNIDPFTGFKNTESFSGGPTSLRSPNLNFFGPSVSILSSPDLLALNDAKPQTSNVATDANAPTNADTISSDGSPSIIYIDGYAYTVYVDNGTVVFDPGSTVENLPRKFAFSAVNVTSSDTDPQPYSSQSSPGLPRSGASQGGPAAPGLRKESPLPSLTSAASIQQIAFPPLTMQSDISQEQRDEENWSAAESGMWDSAVEMTEGLLMASLNLALPGIGLFWQPHPLSWAESGPPAPTGDSNRDAELLDHYRTGEGITSVISIAFPIGAEGILDSALAASTKLPALEGLGMGGGGRLIGATEQWLSSFGEASQSLAPEIKNTLGNADATNLQHVLRGGSEERGIGVLHLDVSNLTDEEVRFIVDDMRDMDYQAARAGGLQRTAVSSSSRYTANQAAALGRETLGLGLGEAAGHIPDVAAGGSPLGPIAGTPSRINSSIGGQWSRYAPGFTFDGFSLINRATGEFLYTSSALQNEPGLILEFSP